MSVDIVWPKVTTGLALLAVSLAAQAAPPVIPGAGTIIQEVEPVTPPSPSPSGTGLSIQESQGSNLPATTPFRVNTLRITGSTVFNAPSLHALVANAEGKDLTLTDLSELAARITDYYHAHGYPLARAILPAQVIRDGVVNIQVIEARYDTISLDNHSRVRDSLLLATVSPLQGGQFITQSPLDHSLLLLSDIPGVIVSATLKPGAAVGTSALQVATTAGPLVTGELTLDNYGDRYTGDVRGGGTVNLIDPLHQGDVLSGSILSSGSGLNDGRLSYDALLDGVGTRAGASFSTLHYILGDSLSALDGSGIAQVGSLWVKQPFVRTPTVNLYGQIQFDHKRLNDDLATSDVRTDRHLNDWTASLAGDWRDGLLAGGVNSWNLAVSSGQLGFDNESAQLADAATARTQGHFTKSTASFARLQSLGPKAAIYVALSAQWASGNLDSAEKLVAGGPYSVRAYAVGALSADTGYLGSLEYRHEFGQFAGHWQGIAFVDSEHLDINKSPWVAGDNSATLSGAGVGVNWMGPHQWLVKASVAASIGGTPVQAGPTDSARAWVEIDKGF
jgi:hemolysin activation/secretion protein